KIQASLPARSKRTQLANILGLLARLKPSGPTEIAQNLRRVAAMVKHKCLLMLFSDLLTDPGPIIDAIRMLRFGGHDVIVFHVLDESEVTFPFDGMCDLKEPETGRTLLVDAAGIRSDYLTALQELRDRYRKDCLAVGADFVPLDTSMRFDKALVEYLSQRKARF
ncbi:MAG: DUF58 domain-containing protein, partial [Bacteroidetes bacterium]|nr:DUF58 domain-containing protein [Bacteroidota bacterium]